MTTELNLVSKIAILPPNLKEEALSFINNLLMKEKKKVAKKKTKRTSAAVTSKDFIKADGTDQTLFENLKIFRTNLAKAKRTKSFKIFPDKTLWEMAQKKPNQLSELEGIFGVGPKKLKKFGKIFIEAISEFNTI